MTRILKAIRNRIAFFIGKNKKFKTEDDFYTFLFTKHPGWNSSEPNEDEQVRWNEIRAALDGLKKPDTGWRILEIGSGRGWLTKKLSEYGQVTGIEPVEAVVKYAKKLFPGLEFLSEVPGTFLQKFPEKKFNLIVSSEVIEHVTDKDDFMQSVFKLLAKDGVFMLTTPRLEHYKDSVEAFGSDPNQPVEEWLSEDQLKILFEKNGFEILTKKFFSPLPNIKRTVLITQLWVGRKKL